MYLKLLHLGPIFHIDMSQYIWIIIAEINNFIGNENWKNPFLKIMKFMASM